jgi:DNA-binding transcriptional regulator PaaX
MPKRGEISEVVDHLLKFTLGAGFIGMGFVAPGSLKAMDKPIQKYFKKIDKRQREREFKKALRYMKSQGLISGNYEHGLQLTEKGKERAQRIEIDQLDIKRPKRWDKKWRIVLYDVPEHKKAGRDTLTRKLRELDFYQLQKSVWVCPFECRKEIESVGAVYEIDEYITYLETNFIDKQEILREKFKI